VKFSRPIAIRVTGGMTTEGPAATHVVSPIANLAGQQLHERLAVDVAARKSEQTIAAVMATGRWRRLVVDVDDPTEARPDSPGRSVCGPMRTFSGTVTSASPSGAISLGLSVRPA
jgi:hypothetical protein